MWNINGLGDKLKEYDVIHLIKSHDIIGIVETKKGDSTKFNLPGYTAYHFSRPYKHKKAKRFDGGILILISKNLSEITVEKHQSCEAVAWVTIKFRDNSKDKQLSIGFVYIPPIESTYKKAAKFHEDLLDEIQERMVKGQVIIAGDLNSRSSNLLDYVSSDGDGIDFPCLTCPRDNVDTTVNTYGRKLIELCINSGLQILNGRNLFSTNTNQYTCFRHNGNSVVDVLMTSADFVSRLTKFEILPRNVNSDHRPLSFDLVVKRKTNSINSPTRDTLSEQFKYMWDSSKIPEYLSSLKNPSNITFYEDFLCNISNASMHPNEVTESFYIYLNNAIANVFKTYKPKSINNKFPSNKWFDSDCKTLKTKVNESYQGNASIEVQNYLRKEYKRVIQLKKREFHIKESKHLSHLCTYKQQDFWRRWKKLKGCTYNNDHITMDKFTEFYQNAAEPKHDPLFDNKFMTDLCNAMNTYGEGDQKPSNEIINDILNGPITIQEIHKAIKSAKTGKACGADGIQSEFIKFSNNLLDKPLLSLYNFIFDKGIFPNAWCTGLINPIFKHNDKSAPENYRKVTLLSALSKIFEYILNNRLIYCKETIIPEDPMQNGFKKDVPVTDNVFILNGIIEKSNAEKKPLYICFVDFNLAFDLINRQALFYKLRKQDIKGRFYKIIRNMLINAQSRVKWDSKLGSIIDNLYGVLQGGVLSPALFKIFIEDLPKYLDLETGIQMGDILINYLLHADDLVLISETRAGLQRLLRGLETFCKRWHITVNLLKTNVMVFNTKYSALQEIKPLFLFNIEIDEVNEYKYLGIIFTNGNDIFAENITNLKNKATRAIGDIRTNISKIIGVNKPYDVMIKLFDSQILPILEYGSEIWCSGNNMPHYEIVHLRYLKYVLGIKQQTPSLAIYGETGRFPLLMRQQDRAVKLWIRLKFSTDNKPINHVFRELERLQRCGANTWLTKIKNIIGDLYDDIPISHNPKQLTSHLKGIRYKKYADKLLADINDNTANPKLRTYCMFKTEYRKEPYLNHISNRLFFTAISRFRTSSHSLHIETGRHTIPYTPIENRICTFCNLNSIDDEIHMLLRCTFHKPERKIFIQSLQPLLQHPTSDYTEKDLFCTIMNIKCSKGLHVVGKYLHTGFFRRKKYRETIITTVNSPS